MILVSGFGVVLGFLSAVVIAIPTVRLDKVEIDPRNFWTTEIELAQRDEYNDSQRDAIKKFNQDLFDAFREQRKYTLIGLVLLALSLAFELSQL